MSLRCPCSLEPEQPCGETGGDSWATQIQNTNSKRRLSLSFHQGLALSQDDNRSLHSALHTAPLRVPLRLPLRVLSSAGGWAPPPRTQRCPWVHTPLHLPLLLHCRVLPLSFPGKDAATGPADHLRTPDRPRRLRRPKPLGAQSYGVLPAGTRCRSEARAPLTVPQKGHLGGAAARRTNMETERERWTTHTHRQAGKQAGRQTDRHTHTHARTHTHTHTHTHAPAPKKTCASKR